MLVGAVVERMGGRPTENTGDNMEDEWDATLHQAAGDSS